MNVDKYTKFSITKFLVLAILLIHVSGCASLAISPTDRMMAGGRYAEVKKQKAVTKKELSVAKSEEIIDFCYACYKLKKYDKLFACLDRLDENIRNGDAMVFRFSFWETFWKGKPRASVYYPQNITVLPPLMRAETLIDFGDYDRAIKNARTALTLNDSVKYSMLDNLANWSNRFRIRVLGVVALAQALKGDRPAARQTLELLENAKVGFVGIYPTLKEKHLMLARVYMALEQYDKVLELKTPFLDLLGSFVQNVILQAKLTGDDLFAFVALPPKFMRTKALHELGKIGEAKTSYDELLDNPGTPGNGDIYWMLLFERGQIAESEGNLQEAIELYRKSIDIIESQRATINSEASKIGFVGDKQNVYHHMVSMLIATDRHATAFEYVERAKSRALVDLLAENRNFTSENLQIGTMLTELDRLELEAKVQFSSGEDVNQRKKRSIEIKKKVYSVAPELYSLVSVSVPSPSEIQSLIAPDETIIEYYYFGADLYVFVITGNDIKAQRLGGANLVGESEDLRKALKKPDSRGYSELSGKLYNRLIRPVEHLIHTKNLIIVPHGILHYLPFNALYDGKEYLIDRYCVSYLPSSSVMKFLKERKVRGGERILVFGNPDLGDPRYDLVYAEKEALTISKIFPESKVFLKSEATETAFKNVGGGFNYIHFACHGIFDADSPLNSGIYLGKDRDNDGRLTVGELYSTRLDAELVTLSACETGMGTIKQGDDVVGLTRGFLYAGSNSIMASLWKVDDLATSQLMAEFYSRLGKTGKREALREAQLSVKSKYKHPYYWAAFQITGKTE
jgi:CHAT domain-containing protein